MPKKRTTLLESANTMPDAESSSLCSRLNAHGMKEEFDEIIAAYVAGKLTLKFSSKRRLHDFLIERMPFKFGITALKTYIEAVKHGKKAH